MAKKPKKMRAYRLKEETIFEIERLSEEWECTHGEVVERAIATVALPLPSAQRVQTKAGGNSELRVEYDVE